jgi:hypothetical protein
MRCRVTSLGKDVRIQFPGNTIKAGVEYTEAFLFVAGAEEDFEVSSLPDSLDPGRKVIVAQRLIRGGLLQLLDGKLQP